VCVGPDQMKKKRKWKTKERQMYVGAPREVFVVLLLRLSLGN
jgi:hypothetical protein